MNFLTNSEDINVVYAILWALEFELSNHFYPIESAHEILDLIKLSNVSSPESGTEIAITRGVGPSILMRAIPNGHSKSWDAWERHTHDVLLSNDFEIVDRVLGGKRRQAALGNWPCRFIYIRFA